MTSSIDVEIFRQKLTQILPANIPIYKVVELDIKAEKAAQVLEAAEYEIKLAALNTQPTVTQWQSWIDIINNKEEILWEQTTKSGKTYSVNLCERLLELELIPENINLDNSTAVLRYSGKWRNDGTMLRPNQILFMLEQVASKEFQLLHIHRNQLILAV